MQPDDIGRLFAEAEARFDRARTSAARTDRALQRADAIMGNAGGRSAAEREAARRERQRLNAGLGHTIRRVVFVILAVWIATMAIGFVRPIGLFGLLAAVAGGMFLVLVALSGARRGRQPRIPQPDADPAVLADRLDSYLFRARPALPAPAQNEVDAMLAALPQVKATLEQVDSGNSAAEDARRLFGKHLPGLMDSYLAVPPGLRGRSDDGDPSVDDRLVEALRAGRSALDDIGERLARDRVAAFETQGRFIESRYKDDEPIER